MQFEKTDNGYRFIRTSHTIEDVIAWKNDLENIQAMHKAFLGRAVSPKANDYNPCKHWHCSQWVRRNGITRRISPGISLTKEMDKALAKSHGAVDFMIEIILPPGIHVYPGAFISAASNA